MRPDHRFAALATGALMLVMTGGVFGQDLKMPESEFPAPERHYSPYVEEQFPQKVYWGDTHLHTSWSTDAGMGGNTVGPDAAYRFAKGEVVTSSTGQPVRLIRPLDFLVVADHAENLGLADFIARDDPLVLKTPTGKRWHEMVKSGQGYDAFIEWVAANSAADDQIKSPEMIRSAWERLVDIGEEHNQPGAFTALLGFEWTSTPGGNNLHRNVIFRDGADRVKQVLPFSLYDSEDPEDLWDYMAAYERDTGGRALAIPHNGNLSNGMMFMTETMDGQPFDADYAQRRAKWERLVEVTQPKGTGEAHPFLSPDDEFADFELIDKGNLSGSQAKTPEMLQYEYARSALKLGLQLEAELGTNPFKFGMIGSTDAHGGLSTHREENWFGKANIVEPSPERYRDVLIASQTDPALSIMATDLGASGLAGVWARENTREALWDAMERREVYGTSGTRMLVRVFAGWDFEEAEVLRPDFARQGYARGVPMGGDLSNPPEGEAPRFMVRALRDPDGANLDRIQIIKGWLDAAGELHEQIYDVACSDERTIDVQNRCAEAVGDTVDVADASYTNSIGDALLGAYWVDPDFDPAARAFYYVRVIEIPTPRWTAFDAKFFGIEMPDGTEMELQERAYTSPIWYTPA
jgi:Protein of unknown function (DUF3604)